MNFNARKASRKWPFVAIGRARTGMVTVAGALMMLLLQGDPAAAARRSPGLWGELFGPQRARAPRPAMLIKSVPLPRPRPAEAPTTEPQPPAAETPTPPARPGKAADQAAPVAPPPSACRLALSDDVAIAPSIPDIHGPGGCGGEDLVRLEAVVLPDKHRVSVKPNAILRCTMASALADWVRTDMAPMAASLGSTVTDLDNFDSYECRGRNRVAGAPLSEHGRANALDVRALKLANGQSIGLTDRTVPRELRERVLHSVCERFTTVLGPGSDGYHEDHIHLDLMERHNNYRICQWYVWDPLPQIAPLLPAERPDEAPPREVATKPDDAKTDAAEPAEALPADTEPPKRQTPTKQTPIKKRR